MKPLTTNSPLGRCLARAPARVTVGRPLRPTALKAGISPIPTQPADPNYPYPAVLVEPRYITGYEHTNANKAQMAMMSQGWQESKLPPISVERVGDKFRIVDGHHRFACASILNRWARDSGEVPILIPIVDVDAPPEGKFAKPEFKPVFFQGERSKNASVEVSSSYQPKATVRQSLQKITVPPSEVINPDGSTQMSMRLRNIRSDSDGSEYVRGTITGADLSKKTCLESLQNSQVTISGIKESTTMSFREFLDLTVESFPRRSVPHQITFQLAQRQTPHISDLITDSTPNHEIVPSCIEGYGEARP